MKNNFKRLVAHVLILSLVYTIAAVPAAQANFWESRRDAVKKLEAEQASRNSRSYKDLAGLPAGLPSQSMEGIIPGPFSLGDIRPSGVFPGPSGQAGQAAQSLKNLPPLLKTLPFSLGDVQKIRWFDNSKFPLVVLIQDAHQIESAQRNIAGILAHLDTEMNRGRKDRIPFLIGKEGAQGAYDLARYRGIKYKKAQAEVNEILLNSSLINGAEFYGLTAESEPLMWGIENEDSYAANVKAYMDGHENSKITEKVLAEISLSLEAAKTEVFSKELNDLDKTLAKYDRQEMGMADTIKILAQFRDIGSALYPETARFLNIARVESSLDFKKVEEERARLILLLSKNLDRPALEQLLEVSLAYRLGRIGYGAYYKYFKESISVARVRIEEYKEFGRYVEYVLLTEDLDADSLFNELGSLKTEVMNRLAKTPAEKELLKKAGYFRLLEKMTRWELNPREWAQYQSQSADIQNLGVKADIEPKSWGKMIQVCETFYKASQDRNTDFVQNLLEKSQEVIDGESCPPMITLIAGGFHTPGLEKELEGKQVSYVTIRPKIGKIAGKGTEYLQVFSKERTPMENLLLGEKLLVDAPNGLAVKPLAQNLGIANRSEMVHSLAAKLLPVFALYEAPHALTLASEIKEALGVEVSVEEVNDHRDLDEIKRAFKVKVTEEEGTRTYPVIVSRKNGISLEGHNRIVEELLSDAPNQSKKVRFEAQSPSHYVTMIYEPSAIERGYLSARNIVQWAKDLIGFIINKARPVFTIARKYVGYSMMALLPMGVFNLPSTLSPIPSHSFSAPSSQFVSSASQPVSEKGTPRDRSSVKKKIPFGLYKDGKTPVDLRIYQEGDGESLVTIVDLYDPLYPNNPVHLKFPGKIDYLVTQQPLSNGEHRLVIHDPLRNSLRILLVTPDDKIAEFPISHSKKTKTKKKFFQSLKIVGDILHFEQVVNGFQGLEYKGNLTTEHEYNLISNEIRMTGLRHTLDKEIFKENLEMVFWSSKNQSKKSLGIRGLAIINSKTKQIIGMPLRFEDTVRTIDVFPELPIKTSDGKIRIFINVKEIDSKNDFPVNALYIATLDFKGIPEGGVSLSSERNDTYRLVKIEGNIAHTDLVSEQTGRVTNRIEINMDSGEFTPVLPSPPPPSIIPKKEKGKNIFALISELGLALTAFQIPRKKRKIDEWIEKKFLRFQDIYRLGNQGFEWKSICIQKANIIRLPANDTNLRGANLQVEVSQQALEKGWISDRSRGIPEIYTLYIKEDLSSENILKELRNVRSVPLDVKYDIQKEIEAEQLTRRIRKSQEYVSKGEVLSEEEFNEVKELFRLTKVMDLPEKRALLYYILKKGFKPRVDNGKIVFDGAPGVVVEANGELEVGYRILEGMAEIGRGKVFSDIDDTLASHGKLFSKEMLKSIHHLAMYGILPTHFITDNRFEAAVLERIKPFPKGELEFLNGIYADGSANLYQANSEGQYTISEAYRNKHNATISQDEFEAVREKLFGEYIDIFSLFLSKFSSYLQDYQKKEHSFPSLEQIPQVIDDLAKALDRKDIEMSNLDDIAQIIFGKGTSTPSFIRSLVRRLVAIVQADQEEREKLLVDMENNLAGVSDEDRFRFYQILAIVEIIRVLNSFDPRDKKDRDDLIENFLALKKIELNVKLFSDAQIVLAPNRPRIVRDMYGRYLIRRAEEAGLAKELRFYIAGLTSVLALKRGIDKSTPIKDEIDKKDVPPLPILYLGDTILLNGENENFAGPDDAVAKLLYPDLLVVHVGDRNHDFQKRPEVKWAKELPLTKGLHGPHAALVIQNKTLELIEDEIGKLIADPYNYHPRPVIEQLREELKPTLPSKTSRNLILLVLAVLSVLAAPDVALAGDDDMKNFAIMGFSVFGIMILWCIIYPLWKSAQSLATNITLTHRTSNFEEDLNHTLTGLIPSIKSNLESFYLSKDERIKNRILRANKALLPLLMEDVSDKEIKDLLAVLNGANPSLLAIERLAELRAGLKDLSNVIEREYDSDRKNFRFKYRVAQLALVMGKIQADKELNNVGDFWARGLKRDLRALHEILYNKSIDGGLLKKFDNMMDWAKTRIEPKSIEKPAFQLVDFNHGTVSPLQFLSQVGDTHGGEGTETKTVIVSEGHAFQDSLHRLVTNSTEHTEGQVNVVKGLNNGSITIQDKKDVLQNGKIDIGKLIPKGANRIQITTSDPESWDIEQIKRMENITVQFFLWVVRGVSFRLSLDDIIEAEKTFKKSA